MSSGSDIRSAPGVPTLANFAGANGTPLVIDQTTGYAYTVKTGDIVAPIGMGGTVTSVELTPPSGVLGLTGSPVTSAGTIVLAWSLAQGDLLQASASNTLSRLPAVATGNALISGGVGVA